MGLDYRLACDRRCVAGRDFPAREVSEGAAFLFTAAVGVAFLGGIYWVRLAPAAVRYRILHVSLDRWEALSAKHVPQNIARRQPDRRDEVVSERGLFARREARDVRRRISAILFA